MTTMSRLCAVTGALLILACPVFCQDKFGMVKGSRVRVRGGPGDAHAVLRQLDNGTPVRVLERRGDWVRVRVPGGVVAYVSAGTPNRPFVREDSPGRGVSLVSRLMIRGTPNADHPSIGALETGDAVELLELEGGWYRVLVDEKAEAWIFGTFVTDVASAAGVESQFAAAAQAERQRVFEASPLARASIAANEVETARRGHVESTFDRFRTEQKKAPEAREPASLEADLKNVVATAPEGSPDRDQATRMLEALKDWDALKKAFAALQVKKDEVRRDTTTRYTEELTKIREKVETRAKEEAEASTKKSPYLATGWVRSPLPLQGVVDRESGYRLERGGQREYILESDRYNLQDYVAGNFLIGIVEADGPYRRPGLTLPVYHVKRLEILAPRERR